MSAASHAVIRRANTARASLDRDAHEERRTNPSTSVRSRSQTAASSSGAPVDASFALLACVRATASDASMTSGSATSATTFSTSGQSSLRPERSRQLGHGLERVDHRQRVDAFVHVVAGRLAELGDAARDVEHVVDDLEAHPEVGAELGERVERRRSDTLLTMPPMRHAVAMSDAVLPSIDEK